MAFRKSIAFKIWLPFAVSILFCIIAVLIYYPKKQEKIFVESTNAKLKELAKTVALGIELSLEHENYEGLQKTINLATSTAEFEFVSIIQKDPDGNEYVFTSNPIDYPKETILKKDESQYVYSEHPFQSKTLSGYVLIATSKNDIAAAIVKLNSPVYSFMIGILLLSLTLFFFFAKNVSRPIKDVTALAFELERGNYNISIRQHNGSDEIARLNNAFFELRDSLRRAKKQNDEFNRALEEEIALRTEALEKTTATLKQAQKIAGLGNYEINLTSGAWKTSESLNTILGIEDAHLKNWNTWQEFLMEEDLNEMLTTFDEIRNNPGTGFRKDIRMVVPDQKEKYIWTSILGESFTENGEIIVKGTIQNITSRKINEEELTRLSLVAQKTSNCVIITDVNRKIIWVNDSVLRVTGYNREEIIGNSPRMFQFEKTDIQTISQIRDKLNSGKEVKAEILNMGKYGNEYWLQLDVVPLYNSKKEISGYIAVEVDITEQKKKEQEINSLLSISHNQNERLKNFAHVVSHNLRAHAANFSALIDILRKQFPTDNENHIIEMLYRSSDSLNKTISDLGHVVRMTSTTLDSLSSVNLGKAAQKAVSDVAVFAQTNQVKIINDITQDVHVNVIPAYLDSILLNFLTNGIKYRDTERESFVRLSYIEEPAHHIVCIEDNGLGIDMEKHGQNLFGMYKRFHRNKDAVGLGLFITKSQIESMGGEVRVQSKVNEGSKFKVVLKKRQPQ